MTGLTNHGVCLIETCTTDETVIVDNNDFLRSIFSDSPNDAKPIVVSFVGDPNCASGSAWAGFPWSIKSQFLPDANNYFSLATFQATDTGEYRRKKANFYALHAIMLDDIGSKIAMHKLCVPPTWLLETSPGNYQAGYMLTESLKDGMAANVLMDAIVRAGLCDPGANGPQTRLARLPVAVNGKQSPVFSCRMSIWAPDRKYSVQELIDGLQLEVCTGEHADLLSPPNGNQPDEDEVWFPQPKENAVLAALRARSLYKTILGNGKHDVVCPWLDEHTGGVNTGTAYFEPNDNWPIGGFHCMHGHCSHRSIRDLLVALELEVDAARMKPTIRVKAGEIHRVVEAAERALAQSGHHYQRGNLIVTVTTDPGTSHTRVQDVSSNSLVSALAHAATWEKYDGRTQRYVRCDPPSRHTSVLYDAISYPHLPVLNGLARQPYLRPDGSLMESEGYDAATGMYGVFNARDYCIMQSPSKDDALAALKLLQNLLTEFSFATPSDNAAALAAILTSAIRPSLPLAPMFHVRAHAVGSGKSYLCELITAFATPQSGAPTTFPSNDEESRKLLLAELLRSPAVIAFDNLTTDLVPHKSLCTALTSEFLTGRILGLSKTTTVCTRALFLSSGNNVGPVRDMARRCITIRLDPSVEIPAARTFHQPHLVRDLLSQRARYVSAALTIIRAWIVAGKPGTKCKALVNYAEWSDLCRLPLLWLGCADPATSVFEAIAEDPDRELLARFLTAWHAVFGNAPAMVRDALRQASMTFHSENADLLEVLQDIAGENGSINRRKLGWWISRHAGRIVDGKRVLRTSSSGSSEQWRVESVVSVLPVSTAPCDKIVNAEAYRRAKSGE